ncbi:MAG: hypothetical protein GXP53_02840 [Deltaproteobacteria bacterium]|nr:hypothetical protein [Deltaproteobacteria bacterium]
MNYAQRSHKRIAKISWKRWLRAASLLLLLLIISACGGGDGLLAGGGIGGTGITSSGPITAFGSIWVNGVEYDVAGADISVNGIPATEVELTRGMIVLVRGSINDDGISGSASSVTYNSNIAGTVTAVDIANNTLTVLGQTVTWDSETFGDDNEPGAWAVPAVGDFIEISALPSLNGWLARAINHHDQSEGNEISGEVESLNIQNHTFMVGGLEIRYQGQVDLQEGDFVEIKGTVNGNVMMASKIEIHTPELAGDNEDMEVEGIVSEYDGSSKALVLMASGGHYQIEANGAVFEHGNESDLLPGARVEVSGYVQDGLFFAEKIEIKGQGQD